MIIPKLDPATVRMRSEHERTLKALLAMPRASLVSIGDTLAEVADAFRHEADGFPPNSPQRVTFLALRGAVAGLIADVLESIDKRRAEQTARN